MTYVVLEVMAMDGARGIKYLLEKKKEKKNYGYQQPNEGLNNQFGAS